MIKWRHACCRIPTVTDSLEVRTDTVGYAFPHVRCKIVDPETGEEMPVGENGEFVARGYNIMKGYYKMPEETAKVIDENGYLHSGDLGYMDEEGYFYVTGRIKDMIIRGGENIYPKEIEEFIYTHPMTKDVQVIGVPDKKYGEEIMACIILKKGENMTVEEMREAIRIIDGRAEAECSGNVTKENVAQLTALGVNYISSGALTHSAPILDISLKNLHAV